MANFDAVSGINSQEIKVSEKINQSGYNKQLNEDDLRSLSVFLMDKSTRSAIQYGVTKGEISQEDANKVLSGQQMSEDGQSAFDKLIKRLQDNLSKVLDFFSNNDESGDNNEAFSGNEFTKINTLMADGIVSDEELEAVTKEIKEAEEAKKAEEAEEAKKAEQPRPWRKGQVVGAFNAIMDDLIAGKDISEISIDDHPGISKGDFERIKADYADDGVMGNGATKSQFKDDNIYNEVKARLVKEKNNGTLDQLKVKPKIENGDDNTGYDSETGEDYKLS